MGNLEITPQGVTRRAKRETQVSDLSNLASSKMRDYKLKRK